MLVAVAATVALVGTPAGAHAFLLGQFPKDGEILDVAPTPTVVGYDFNEAVSVDPAGFALRDAEGRTVSGPASVAGLPSSAPRPEEPRPGDAVSLDPTRVSVTSSSPLAAGGYAIELSVRSIDGHQLVQAYGFAVGQVPQVTNTQVPVHVPAIGGGSPLAVTFDGSSPGSRTVRVPVPDGVTGGEVRLTCRREPGERIGKVRAPFLWRLGAPQDGTATATGYLPVPCSYTLRITLERAFPASPTSYVTTARGPLLISARGN